jgi:chromosome segregation ATPase
MRAQIDAKIAALTTEMQRAEEELRTLRPRVQYLESMVYRLDGALTALQSLLEHAAEGDGAVAQHEAAAGP